MQLMLTYVEFFWFFFFFFERNVYWPSAMVGAAGVEWPKMRRRLQLRGPLNHCAATYVRSNFNKTTTREPPMCATRWPFTTWHNSLPLFQCDGLSLPLSAWLTHIVMKLATRLKRSTPRCERSLLWSRSMCLRTRCADYAADAVFSGDFHDFQRLFHFCVIWHSLKSRARSWHCAKTASLAHCQKHCICARAEHTKVKLCPKGVAQVQ